MFFDSHLHNLGKESGGFIIGLENKPFFEGTLNNEQVLLKHDPKNNYVAFYYVTNSNIQASLTHKYLKYHPRREHYSLLEMIDSIGINTPKCVIIDTLNEPYLVPYDYWRIAQLFPEIIFIFTHAGGYLINDFIKICNFQPNVWLDFALTATQLGCLSKPNGLPYINQAINYSLNNSFSDRILLGSDYPFFKQDELIDYYNKLNKIELLNTNFKNLLEMIV